MLITCSKCSTSYEIEPCSFGLTGRSVRCIRCAHTWFAANITALGAIAQIHRVELGIPPAPLVDEPGAKPREDSVVESAGGDFAIELTPFTAAETRATRWGFTLPASPSRRTPASNPTVVADLHQADPAPVNDAAILAPAGRLASKVPVAALRPRQNANPAAAAPSKNERAERRGSRYLTLFGVILVLGALNAALVRWRPETVRVLPQTASLYAAVGLPINLRGLEFTDVQTASNQLDGVGLLVVEGNIANTTSRRIDVPRIHFSARDERGLEIYNWTAAPSKTLLDPGESLPFRSRLASPPAETHRVFVRFRNRRDLVAGLN